MSAVYRLLTFLLVAASGLITQALPYKPSVQAFLLQAGSTLCTATLISPNYGSCKLVTNAHCVFNANIAELQTAQQLTQISSEVTTLFAESHSSQKLQVTVLKRNSNVDLAELSVPNEIRSKLCYKLASTTQAQAEQIDAMSRDSRAKRNDSVSIMAYASLGFHSGLPVVSFSQNLDWVRGWAPEELLQVPTSLKALKYLYRLDGVQMQNGMSGGPTLNQRYDLVGINVRFVPYQTEMQFVPVKDVLAFLAGSLGDDGASGLVGNNDHRNGGENAGANGGENAGANGSDDSKPNNPNDVLFFLREPDEGVDFKTDAGIQRLLGLGSFQIDGWDDLRLHQDQNLKSIYRESSEFKRVQETIFDRLQGFYEPSEPGARATLSLLNLDSSAKWVTQVSARPYVSLKVEKQSKMKARLELYVSEFIVSSAAGAKVRVQPRKESFAASLSGDFKTISLVSDSGRRLSCSNIYYLKLICSSTDTSKPEELSLSLTSEVGSSVKIRHSELMLQQNSIEYLYGNFSRMR